MPRYRRNTGLELSAPTPGAGRPKIELSGRMLLGIVVNPKLQEPLITITDGDYVGIRSLRANNFLARLGVGYYESDRHSDYAEPARITGYPRAHTPDGVAIKGGGYGTSLYTALSLGAYANYNLPDVAIDMWPKNQSKDGISSASSSRSHAASRWWSAAASKGLTEEHTETEEEVEEGVDLNITADEIEGCVTLDYEDAKVRYVNTLNVDIEREKEVSYDIYEYESAEKHNLVAVELGVAIPESVPDESAILWLWKEILKTPGTIYAAESTTLLALDVRGLDPDAVNFLSLAYIASGLSENDVDDMRYRWEANLDPGTENRQGRLFRANQGGMRAVEDAREQTRWAELADLP